MTRKLMVVVVVVVVVALVAGTAMAKKTKVSPQAAQLKVSSTHLLDRGVARVKGLVDAGRNPALNTLMVNPTNGPGATAASTYLWWNGSAIAYMGNLFQGGADFPTSWYPFDVTGVFAWHWVTGAAHMSATYLAAASLPNGQQNGTWTLPAWPAAGEVQAVSFGNGMQAGMVGGKNLFAANPVDVDAGEHCACGLRALNSVNFNQDGVGMNPNPGNDNTHWAYWGTLDIYASYWWQRNTATPVFPNYWGVAGCYVSGATVPVELLRLEVE
jgi:hypothetical protein